jgi:glycosyltransferase involved in cell wall biosynthesis
MPAYNSECFIEESIRSVLAQTFLSWELLVIDDCSADSTTQIVARIAASDARIILLELSSNSGAAVARNFGISRARGRYLAFLDSDDLWYPYKLQSQLDFMRSVGATFCYSAYHTIDQDGYFLGRRRVPRQVTYYDLLKTCHIGCLTAIYDTQRFGKVFMPEIRKRQDLGLWLRLLRQEEYAHGLSQPLARYRIRKDSISANKWSAAKSTWDVYRAVEGLTLPQAMYYFAHYAVCGYIRHNLLRIFSVLRKTLRMKS